MKKRLRVVARKASQPASNGNLRLKDLVVLSKNARKRTQRSSGMLVSSLQEFGAARSIVIDESNVILAGNGTVAAAAEAGIERVRVVEADGHEIIAVRRRGMSEAAKVRYALADNRAAELAEWDTDMLREFAPENLAGLWEAGELSGLVESGDGAGMEPQLGGMEYRVVVDCSGERQQGELIERLEAEGLKCRPLIS